MKLVDLSVVGESNSENTGSEGTAVAPLTLESLAAHAQGLLEFDRAARRGDATPSSRASLAAMAGKSTRGGVRLQRAEDSSTTAGGNAVVQPISGQDGDRRRSKLENKDPT